MASRRPRQDTRPVDLEVPHGQALEERMTIDSVVMRTAMTLGLVILTGALTWVFLPDGPASAPRGSVARWPAPGSASG